MRRSDLCLYLGPADRIELHALMSNLDKAGRAVREWVAARNQLAIKFTGRFDA